MMSMSIFLIASLLTSFMVQFINGAEPTYPDSIHRRILHQPLFTSATPPPPPPPAPADLPDDQGQPFSNELPNGPTTFDQSQQPPPLPAFGASVENPEPVPVATHQAKSNPTNKVAVAILSAILTLGMLSAMLFYLYKNRLHHSQNRNQNSQLRMNEESRMPPSTCTRALVNETNGAASGSPYRNLSSAKRYDHYRPGPYLHEPLPPLTKPRINSPPPMSSSSDDDVSDDSRFPAPQVTSTSSNTSQINQPKPDIKHASSPVPHSKRTPPKSRFSTSSPDARLANVMIPSTKHSMPPSPPPPAASLLSKTLPYSPNRTKFSASPPSRDIIERRRSISINEHQQRPKIPIPNPPPPPPPPPRIFGAPKTGTIPSSKRSLSKTSPSRKATPVEEVNKVGSWSEKFDAKDKEGSRSRPKMDPLHWDKVRAATTNGATVWDQLKSTSFQLNEDAMDSLFGRNSATSVTRESTKKFVVPSFEQEHRLLDFNKSRNIAILLRALNVTREEVSEALLDGNPEGLCPELFESLVKMAPSNEEEMKLKHYNDEISKLGPAERFLRAILDIPFAFKRVEAMLYRANFTTEVTYLRKSFQTLEEASEELKNSRLFLKLLEAVLKTGNRMNNGTNRGDAKAFKLDTLLKLVDIKGIDGKTTLLHFVVQEIVRSEGAAAANPTSESFDLKKQGLQIVAGLSKELGNVKNAAGMDTDVLSSYVSKLELGLQKVEQVLQYKNQDKFFDSMKVFLEEAVDEISRVKAEERKALSLVKEVTVYFHGDAARNEAHPLRIFVIIRDFLSILDNVCKDVGRSFRISATAQLPVLINRYNLQNDTSSDDD